MVRGRMVYIPSIMMATKIMVHTLVLLTVFLSLRASAQSSSPAPMKCSSAFEKSPCVSYLYFNNNYSQHLSDIARNFNVFLSDILVPEEPIRKNYLIRKNCTCNGDYGSTSSQFFTNVSYTPVPADGNLSAQSVYSGLIFQVPAVIPLTSQTEMQLLCGCPFQHWTTTVTYIVQPEDQVDNINKMFKSDTNDIQILNNLTDIGIIGIGQNLFIPTNFTPSSAATEEASTSSSSSSNRSSGLVAGVISAVVVLFVLLLITACLYWWNRLKNHGVYSRRSIVEHSGASLSGPSNSHLGRFGFIGSWFNSNRAKSSGINNNVKRSITLPREAMDVFDQEKPIIFTYEEIIEATDNFKASRMLGQGSYGAVYYGILREQNVAVKQMKTTKSREFYAELKVLCKVHHTNLEDSLFLIYEFAEHGALSQHLHQTRGSPQGTSQTGLFSDYPPLSWTARVQIALDTARGLEYIHDHTKAHYVHRDVKSSNILLDGFFRAKVADFGLAKLVEQNSETFVTTTRVVGTFGYMPPEYLQGGKTTSKSDVYAFGVVLFELITGRKAMTRTNSSRRSLISFMLEVLNEEHDPRIRFLDVVDPRLGKSFPLEWSFKVAKLAKACVDEDAAKRPDMRTVVFSLSQFLLNSVEWEAASGGSSQIFSGLTQGR